MEGREGRGGRERGVRGEGGSVGTKPFNAVYLLMLLLTLS